MVNSIIPKTAEYNGGARVILVVVFLPFYSASLQVGWHQYKVFITILFLQVSKLGYILNLPLFKRDYTKLLSVINY
jgi:hypothetical protein